MGLNKRLFASSAKCLAETADIFGDSSGIALYSLDYDASDASGNYDGTPTSAVKFGKIGQINYAAEFDGADGTEIITPIDSSVLDLTSAWSVSCWLRFDVNANSYTSAVGMMEVASPFEGFAFLQYGSKVGVSFNGGAQGLSGNLHGTFTLGQWHHCVITYSGSTSTKFYFDGTLTGTDTTNTFTNPPTSIKFRMGDKDVWAAHNGDIEQVRVFTKELSQSEVSTLYAEERCVHTGTTDDNAVGGTNIAYYKFDGDYTDEKGSYNGTAYGVAGFKFGRFGSALDFNGTESRMSTGYTRSGSAFAISMWVYATDTGARQVLVSDSDNGGADANTSLTIRIGTNDNLEVYLFGTSGSLLSATTSYSSYYNKWTHIAVSISGSRTATVWLDNNKTVGTTVSGDWRDGLNAIAFGHWWGGSSSPSGSVNEFVGLMDQVRMFNSSLDQADVDALYAEKQEHIVLNSSDPFDDDECKLHLKLDNNSNDSVNSSNNGTDTNMLYSSSDKVFGTHSADFSTSGSKIIIPAIDLSAATISLWAKIPNVNTTYNLINKYNDDGTLREWNIYNYQTSNGFVPYNYYNNNNGNGPIVSAGDYLSNNKWHHIVLAINATTQPQLYFDGVLVKTATGTLGYSTGNPNIELGYSNSTYDFSGKMDQVRIFDRKLTGAEIFKLYAEATLN